MTIEELGDILRDMCAQEWGGGKTVAMHLFGIQYRQEIEAVKKRERRAIPRIVEHAGLNPPNKGNIYGTEVSKGMALEPNVSLKQLYRPMTTKTGGGFRFRRFFGNPAAKTHK